MDGTSSAASDTDTDTFDEDISDPLGADPSTGPSDATVGALGPANDPNDFGEDQADEIAGRDSPSIGFFGLAAALLTTVFAPPLGITLLSGLAAKRIDEETGSKVADVSGVFGNKAGATVNSALTGFKTTDNPVGTSGKKQTGI